MSTDHTKRTWQVTVKDLCNECNELKEGVESRTWNNGSWSNRKTFTLNSCKACYDKRMAQEIKDDNRSP